MTAPLLEPLDRRQLMAANPYLDTAFNGTGVSTLTFRLSADDSIIQTMQIVNKANSSTNTTYVLAKTKSTAQVRRLQADGTVDTGFGKNGLLLLPIADNERVKIDADTTGNLILLAGNTIYRFDGLGQSLNPNFGTGGALKLSDFTGKMDMDVDAANKIYVTGETKNGDGILVQRFISRGKRDVTFNNSGQVVVPLPCAYRTLENPVANGVFVRVIDDATPDDSTDDQIIVAGDASADSYDGVETVRLNYNGTLQTGYGTNGVAYLLAQKSNEAVSNSVTLTGALPDGRVGITALSVDNPGLGGTTSVYTGTFLPNGNRDTTSATGRPYINAVAAPNDTYVGLTSDGLYRYNASNALIGTVPAISGASDIAAYGPADDDGLAIFTVSFASKAGRLNVTRYLPGLVPVLV
ncbi:MAG: hypothetical protein QM754_10550 [Tepidisphaeraceae bacterium]